MDKDSIDELLKQLSQHNRRALAKIISLVENGHEREYIMHNIIPHTGESYILGITGPPGAGKSSLVEALTHLYRKDNESIGILAVDPSSPYTGGAILGDRIRMQSHADDKNVFIRSMGTRGHLGGIAASTGDVIKILEFGGFRRLILETVGVGQSEIDVMNLANTVVVILNPNSGDGIQAIKAGIMEIADIFVINKSDLRNAEQMKNDVEMMLNLQYKDSSWKPPVVLTSVLENRGLSDLHQRIEEHKNLLMESGLKYSRNKLLIKQKVWSIIEKRIHTIFSSVWTELTEYIEKGEKSYPIKEDYDELAEKIWIEIKRNYTQDK